MRGFIFTSVAALVLSSPAFAAEKISVQEVQSLSTALRNLDGHIIVIKQAGQDATVMQPWEFGSGSLRLRIANDIAIVDHSLKLIEDARQGMVKEGLKKLKDRTGEDSIDIKQGTPEFDAFQKQFLEFLAQPAPGTQDLSRIKASELRLDKNEVPVTVLSALKPIMDDDTK